MDTYTLTYFTADGKPAEYQVQAYSASYAVILTGQWIMNHHNTIHRPALYGPKGEEIMPAGEIWF